jgi:OmpA-OmpF porin, OOP family
MIKTTQNLLLMIFFLGLFNQNKAQDMKDELFKDVKVKIDAAISESVNLMSPSFFDEALEYFKSAEKDFKEGSSLTNIKEQLSEAGTLLDKAFKTSEVGKVTFANVLEARDDAVNVYSQKNVPEMWMKAEDKLREAGEDLEDGDVNDARDEAKSAENLFRAAELEAIKISYLVETRNQIKRAEDEDVSDTAPVTLSLAKKLVNDCEKELNNNRYDMDLPRSLAKQAQYEISHAFFVDNLINDFDEKDETLENIILSAEAELGKVAAAIEVEKNFASGLSLVADNAVEKIEQMKTANAKLNETVLTLEQEVKLLKEELSGLSAEKSELAGKMDRLKIIKQKYATVDKMFSTNEAQVLRKENDIIIRLVGLSFDVGKAIIEARNFGLLTKLKDAIKEFPDSKMSIEGYTDSFGGDAQNLALSQKRADAVTQYLLANTNISKSNISSIGYGETNPIANNETKEGRAKNRRIDLILHND